MGKEIEIDVRMTSDKAKKGFDGLNVSAKDLQTRLADLDKQMEKLLATQGKQAYQSAQGQRITRERTAALNQLLIIEEKHDVAQKKSIRGLGSLGSAALAATGSISGLGTGVSVLTSALMSGAGLTAGLAAAVAGFSLLMEYMRTTGEEFQKMKGLMSSLVDVKMPGGTVKVDPNKIPEMIRQLKQQRDENARSEKYLYELEPKGMDNLEEKATRTVDSYNAMIEVLEETRLKHIDLVNAMQLLSDAGYKLTDDTKKNADDIKRSVNDWYKWMTTMPQFQVPKNMADLLNRNEEQNIKRMRFGRGGDIGGMPLGAPIPQEEYSRLMQERDRDMQQFAQASAGIFTTNMNQAWENIFGEANSMFEQLLVQWQSMLFEKIGFGIFNMLFGGIDLFGFARNLTAGNATAAKFGMGR